MGLIGTDDPRWVSVLAELEHDFYQLPAYAALCAEQDGGHAEAFLYRTPDITLLVPLVFLFVQVGDRSVAHAGCPYGYPGLLVSPGASAAALAGALQELAACLKHTGAVSAFLRLHPLQSLPDAALERAGTLVTHGQTVSIDLSCPLDESWRAMRQTHRRHIQAGQRKGYTVRLGWEGLDGYLDCYLETMRRVSASERYAFDRRYVLRLREALGDRLQMCTVQVGADVACAGLFSELGGIVQYHLGGTKDAFLLDSPMKLMFDHMRRWGHERGNRALHLGGGVGAAADALFEFKAGFSRQRHTFQTLRLIVDRAEYEAACQEAGVSASASAFFPPFAQRQVEAVPALPRRLFEPLIELDRPELLAAPEGQIELGWAAPQVLCVRLVGKLSDPLASQYMARLEQRFSSGGQVQFFIDASALETYELSARNALTRFLVSQRQRLGRVVLLNWLGGMSSVGKVGAQQLEPRFELALDREDFESKLGAVAPLLPAWLSAVPDAPLRGEQKRNDLAATGPLGLFR